jgi:hypothetical protein
VSAERNKAIVRRFVDEFLNEGREDALDALAANDCVCHVSALAPGLPEGRGSGGGASSCCDPPSRTSA